eukprot:gene18376-24845_t
MPTSATPLDATPLREDTRECTPVCLHGLNAKDLNGAIGCVTDLDPDTCRWGVRLLLPPAVAKAHPNGVRVRPENLTSKFGTDGTHGLVLKEMRK